MKSCDVCGCRTEILIELREIYQTNEIREICPDCEKIVNKKLSALQSAVSQIQLGWMKRFMENIKNKSAEVLK